VGLRAVDLAIAGGGLAGMALALDLARAGRRVALCERRGRLGGALGRVETPLGPADNSVHLILAGFGRCLRRLEELGTRSLLADGPPSYRICIDGAWTRLSLPADVMAWVRTPAALARWRSPAGSGLELLPGLLRLLLGPAPTGGSAADWLAPRLPGRALAGRFWREWALSVFNAPLEAVDGGLFVRTARRLFARPGQARPLLARASLEALWLHPLERALRQAGVELHLGTAVRAVRHEGGRLRAWVLDQGELAAEQFVWAGAPEAARAVPGLGEALPALPPRRGRHIANLLLAADRPPDPAKGLTGFFGENFQWIFPAGEERIALVASGLDDGSLADRQVLHRRGRELARQAGCEPRGEGVLIVQRQATPLPDERFERARPGAASGLENLHWCGAWTATGLPQSMESALASAESLRDLLLLKPMTRQTVR
jgi:glycine/D-amino acid oxidase-like deaminating enzyme